MTEAFDPYHKWLGIPPGRRPPNHYELLGIALYESDIDVISNAADRRMSHIKTFASGPQAKISQLLLNQLSEARICLSSPKDRIAYDRQLRQQLSANAGGKSPKTTSNRVTKGSRPNQKLPSDSTIIGLGISLFIGSILVTFLASTKGRASFREVRQIVTSKYAEAMTNATNKKKLQVASDSVADPNQVAEESPNTTSNETASDDADEGSEGVEMEAEPPNGSPIDSGLEDGDEPIVPDGPNLQTKTTGKPPSPEFYEAIDGAFDALMRYDYRLFRQYRNAAEKIIETQELDPDSAETNLQHLDEIGEGYVTIWKLVDVMIPNLKRQEILKLPKINLRVVTAVEGRIRVETKGKKIREYRTQGGPLPVYMDKNDKDMPLVLAKYLADRAIKENLLVGVMNTELARRAIEFDREFDSDALPTRPTTRWSLIESIWEETL